MKAFLRSNLIFFIFALLMPVIGWASLQLDDYSFRILMYAGINIILATSLNLVNGITGQFSLGHAGFMAVGAYVSASLTYFYLKQPLSHPWIAEMLQSQWGGPFTQLFFFGSLLIGGLSSAILGFIVGVPSLRLRGDYLAIVTLGFGEIIRVVILNIDTIGGARGFPDIPPITNFYWVYACVVFTVIALVRIVNSSHGRALLAIRENEIAAESVGVSTTHYKVLAFVVSSFFAGIAGGLLAHYMTYLNPASFTFIRSFEIITMVVLGGMGSFSGSMFTAVALTILPETLRGLQDYRMVIYSLLLIVMMLTRPHGLMGKRELWCLKKKRA